MSVVLLIEIYLVAFFDVQSFIRRVRLRRWATLVSTHNAPYVLFLFYLLSQSLRL
jgi:hypothetical protein